MALKKINLCTLIVLLNVGIFGCETKLEEDPSEQVTAELNEAQEQDTEASVPDQKLKIAFSMDTLVEERWEKDRDMFVEAVKALGAEIEVKAANGNDALQIAQAETLISQDPDLLVLVPHNAEVAATIVGKAKMAEIPVIAYDRLVKNANVDLYISFDSMKVGALQAEAITELVPKGKYVYIGGASTDNNAHLLKEGVFSVLQPYIEKGDITVVYDQWSDAWTPASAKLNMEEALAANDNQIDAVIAANDATAGSVIEVLEEYGLAGQIPVAGQDAELAGIQRIIDGTQAMTVYKPIKELSKQAAEIAVRMAGGEMIETNLVTNNGKKDIPTVFLDPIAVNQDNIYETVIADGFHQLEDLKLDEVQ
ncbi:sugar ABC transporter substrate-binding protein [Amphibacillus sediminis]|uniref:sugar ABC transporter substrate-binding protein n=1 Tax=Amphibacillus sediminis TaxID=360185 RepID=UPI00082BB148|nr:substrate-binding domain-containing protein [Amphibacillus sediminis]